MNKIKIFSITLYRLGFIVPPPDKPIDFNSDSSLI